MGIKLLKTLAMAPGVTMAINVNEDEPTDSVDRILIDVTCTGEPGAQAITVPAHWHKNHSEIFTVLEGRVEVTLNGVKKLFRAGDQDLLIPARAVHSVRGFEGERLVMRERSDPPGDYKALFFNDLLSTGSFDSFSHFLRASYDGDAYIALPLYFRFLDVVFMTVAGGIAHLFAPRKVEAL